MQQRLNSLSCAQSIFNTAALRWVRCKEGSYVMMWMSSSPLGCLSSFLFNTSATSYGLLDLQEVQREGGMSGQWHHSLEIVWQEAGAILFCFSVIEVRGYGIFLCAILGPWQIFTPTSPCAFYCKCCFAWLFWNNRGDFPSSTIMMAGNIK